MNDVIIANKIAQLNTDFFTENAIKSLRLFGSQLHGHSDETSDIDLLVEFEPSAQIGYFDLSRIQLYLADVLGANVDLRTPAELSNKFRHSVLNEAISLYERN